MEKYLTVDEVAKILKIGKKTVYKLIHNAKMPAIKIQHQYRIPESQLYDWLASYLYCQISI